MKLDLSTVMLTLTFVFTYVFLIRIIDSCTQVIYLEKCQEVCNGKGDVFAVNRNSCICKDEAVKK